MGGIGAGRMAGSRADLGSAGRQRPARLSRRSLVIRMRRVAGRMGERLRAAKPPVCPLNSCTTFRIVETTSGCVRCARFPYPRCASVPNPSIPDIFSVCAKTAAMRMQ